MLYKLLSKNPVSKILLLTIFYTCIIWVFYVFIIHGIKGIEGAHSFMQIAAVLGFSEPITRFLILIVGILDLIVAFLLLLHPRWWVLIWAGVWPWVPFLMILYAGGSTHAEEFVLTSGGAIIALLIYPTFTPLALLQKR